MASILCVDEPEVLRTRRLVLEQNGFEVRPARSSNEALKLVADHVIDCAVVRHDPPALDGLKVASEIRKSYPRIPIVLLTVTPQHSAVPADECLSNLDGPEALIDAVKGASKKRMQGRLRSNLQRSLKLREDFHKLENKTINSIRGVRAEQTNE